MEKFDYDETFMGASSRKSWRVSFIQDYRLKRLTQTLLLKNGKLLDIGCGGGITTEALAFLYPKVELYGCDVSKSALKYAKKYGSGNVAYKRIIGKKLPYKDNYFDACTALDVMEHVPDLDFFLLEVNRVLKKNGKFFSHTPAEGQPLTHTWLWKKIGIGSKMTYKRFGHIHPELTHAILVKLVESRGFKVKETTYSEHLLFQLSSLFFYFLPLELLDSLLKKEAYLYKDKSIIKSKNKKQKLYLIWTRLIWLSLTKLNRYLTYLETIILKSVSFGALKTNILAAKK